MLGSALLWSEVFGLWCDLTELERSLEANEGGIVGIDDEIIENGIKLKIAALSFNYVASKGVPGRRIEPIYTPQTPVICQLQSGLK